MSYAFHCSQRRRAATQKESIYISLMESAQLFLPNTPLPFSLLTLYLSTYVFQFSLYLLPLSVSPSLFLISLSFFLSIYLSFYLSIYLYASIFLFIYVPVSLPPSDSFLSPCFYLYISIYSHLIPSNYEYLSIYLFLYLSIYLSIFISRFRFYSLSHGMY